MNFNKITEQESNYGNLEKLPISHLLECMNNEDQCVPIVLKNAIPELTRLTEAILDKLFAGGRLFYLGAGTSGRIGVLDASECPPTFGVSVDIVNGIIAGGDKALRNAVEGAEDDFLAGWDNLQKANISIADVVIGITASGTTPYVLGALQKCRQTGILTAALTCNPSAPVSRLTDICVELVVGPEFITGSTRMKAGTAQKLALNMISTALMIKLGRVEGNRMVYLQPSNEKLLARGVEMVLNGSGTNDSQKARQELLRYRSVKKAIEKIISAKNDQDLKNSP